MNSIFLLVYIVQTSFCLGCQEITAARYNKSAHSEYQQPKEKYTDFHFQQYSVLGILKHYGYRKKKKVKIAKQRRGTSVAQSIKCLTLNFG